MNFIIYNEINLPFLHNFYDGSNYANVRDMKRSGVRGYEPIPVTNLASGINLANCTETVMFYDRLLAAGVRLCFL